MNIKKVSEDGWPSGTGLFETIRVEDGKVFALHRHHCRVQENADRLGVVIPKEAEVAQASYQEISKFSFRLGRLRWHFDLAGDFTLSYAEFEDPLLPARLTIHDERSDDYTVRKKQYPYRNLDWIAKAKADGFDDAIILTKDGQISETTVATLLLKINGEWVTPPLSSGILNGVVRALVLEAGLAKVRRVEEAELEKIDSALLLTSLRNSQIVGEIAGRKLSIDTQKNVQIHELMQRYKGM